MNDQDPSSGTNDNKDMRGPSRSFLKVCVDFWGLALTYSETIRAQTMVPEDEHICNT